MKMKRKEIALFSLISIISAGSIAMSIGVTTNSLNGDLVSQVEAGPTYDCNLAWTSGELIENSFSLSNTGKVQLTYGSEVTQNSDYHALLKSGNSEANFIATSGKMYDGMVGGFVNGLNQMNIQFDDTIANLNVEAWNSALPLVTRKNLLIKKSGLYNIPGPNSSIKANQFKITRVEKETGGDSTKLLGIKAININCSANELPVLTEKVVANNYDELQQHLGNPDYANKYITLGNDIEYPIPYEVTKGLAGAFNIKDKDIVLDFAGHRIKPIKSEKSFTCVPVALYLRENANVTLVDSSVEKTGGIDSEYGDKSIYAINIGNKSIADSKNYPTLEVEGGTYTGAPTCIQVNTGTLNVKNGVFNLNEFALKKEPEKAKYIINGLDNSWEAGLAKINLSGGTYGYDYSVCPETNGIGYLAQYYDSLDNGNATWSIFKSTKLGGELGEILANTNYYKLNSDLDFFKQRSGSYPHVSFSNPDLTIDLNGHAIKPAKNATKDSDVGMRFFEIYGESNVRIIDSSKEQTGLISTDFGTDYAYTCYGFDLTNPKAKLTIDSGKYLGSPSVVQVTQGQLFINGGEFQLTPRAKEFNPEKSKYIINAIDDFYKKGTANIVITGGTFGFDPSANPEGTNTSYVPGFAKVEKANENYVVSYDATVPAVVNTEYDLDAYFALPIDAKNHEVKLGSSIAVNPGKEGAGLRPRYIVEGFDFTLDLAGKQLTFKPESKVEGVPCFFGFNSGNTFTIKDSVGQGVMNAELGNNSAYACNIKHKQAILNIEGGTFYGAPTGIQVQFGTLNVNGGHFDLAPTCKSAAPGMAKYEINCIDDAFENGTAKINVTNADFANFDPASHPESNANSTYIAEGSDRIRKTNQTTGEDTYYVKPVTTVKVTTETELINILTKHSNDLTKVVLENDILVTPHPFVQKNGTDNVIDVVNENVILELNGHKISWDLKDSGVSRDFLDSNGGKCVNVPVMFRLMEQASMEIRDSIGTGTIDVTYGENTSYALYVYSHEATLTIAGGNYIAAMTVAQVRQGSLNITAGKFETIQPENDFNRKYIINCLDGHYKDGFATVRIYGGTFQGDFGDNPEGPNTTYAAPGYDFFENTVAGEVPTWTVKPCKVKVVNNEKELLEAMALSNSECNKIVLGSDIVLTPSKFDPENKTAACHACVIVTNPNIILDINGHNITWDQTNAGDERGWLEDPTNPKSALADVPVMFKILGNGRLTIRDSAGKGSIDSSYGENTSYGIYVFDEGSKLRIESGNFNSSMSCVQLRRGKCWISGGTFKTNHPEIEGNTQYIVNILDKHSAYGKFYITGGSFQHDISQKMETSGNVYYLVDGYETKLDTKQPIPTWNVVRA